MKMQKAVVRSCVATFIAAASLVTGHAVGIAPYGYEKDYYSDASETDVVGGETRFCSGGTYTYGTVTQYSKEVLRWSCE
jgi:hypothetical protein